jgi:hypothetical protein
MPGRRTGYPNPNLDLALNPLPNLNLYLNLTPLLIIPGRSASAKRR